MAVVRIQDTVQLTLIDELDFIPIIDKSDTSGSTAGTGKHSTIGDINDWVMNKDQIVTGSWSFTKPITMSSSITDDFHLTNKLYSDTLSPWRTGSNEHSATINEPGYNNNVNSIATAAIGGNNTVGYIGGGDVWNAYGSFTVGAENSVTNGYYNFVSGFDHTVEGHGNLVSGAYNKVGSTSLYSMVSGYRNEVGAVSGPGTFLYGSYVKSSGQGIFISGNVLNVAVEASPTKVIEVDGNFNHVFMNILESSTNGSITGNYNFVSGFNHGITHVDATHNSLLGGKDHTITSNYSYSSVVGGQNINVSASETVYVPRLEIAYDDSEIIMRSPDGTRYSLKVSNGGTFSVSVA